MQIIKLYKYTRLDGGISISPIKPEDNEYLEEGIRLIADEGKILTNDKELTYCIDVPSSEGWYEVEDNTQNISTLMKDKVNERPLFTKQQ